MLTAILPGVCPFQPWKNVKYAVGNSSDIAMNPVSAGRKR